MTTHALTQSIPRPAARRAPRTAPSPGPLGIVAVFAAVPVAVAAVLALAPPAAALVIAFALVLVCAVTIGLRALDMASDDGDRP